LNRLQESIDFLNSKQRQAFEVEGHCVVEAPPGSGKTRLLVTRLAYDLSTAIARPQGAACITLTNAAAAEVNGRFHSLSGDDRPNLYIGTVHGFALNRIVRPFGHLLDPPFQTSLKVASQAESDRLWEEAFEDLGVSDLNARRLLKSTVSRYRNLMIGPDVWSDKQLVAALRAYESRMLASEMIDYAKIIETAVQIVEKSPVVQTALQASFPRIYVDEYQDLAPGLDRIVRALCFGAADESSTLFAVGDVDQAIYGWTGTNSRLLREVATLPGVTTVTLDINYRNGRQILDLSRRLFAEKSSSTAERDGGYVQVEKVSGMVPGQISRMSESVSKLHNEGVPLHEIGIFTRTNDLASDVAEQLRADGLPVWVKISEDWESPLSLLFERMAAWVSHGEMSGIDIGSLVLELRRSVPGADSDAVGRLVGRLTSANGQDHGADFVDGLCSELSKGASLETTLLLDDLQPYLSELTEGGLSSLSVSELGGRRMTGERVYVTTLAACKGLEFDYVFIPDMDDGRIPFFANFDSDEAMEEERNKFYVGLTRARFGVTLLWSGQTATRHGSRSSEVSRFITTLNL
jgi:DNA helicase-2/ATP-dependent DNA helicase PcrA